MPAVDGSERRPLPFASSFAYGEYRGAALEKESITENKGLMSTVDGSERPSLR
jgi:hypothetical protein